MVLTDQPEEVDILFLCLPHKESQNWLTQNPVKDETLVIDLGNDFRLDGNFESRNFIYGLPEINKKQLSGSKSIANPGCFATAIQLALLPLAEKGFWMRFLQRELQVLQEQDSLCRQQPILHGEMIIYQLIKL
jgi:N-acetyl-gamma-glutamyl-phosphate reductase